MTKLEDLFPNRWVIDLDCRNKDKLIGKKIDYLDKGFVQLVDVMGDDMTVADGARTSFRKSAEEYSEKRNKGLIRYLMEHKHTSPFELPAMMFRVKVPLFVRAQHIRHRTQSCNWESQRYKEQCEDFYVPPVERIRKQDRWNKQGSGERLESAERVCTNIKRYSEDSYIQYQNLLERGVSRELARLKLQSNFYCTGVFSMKLRNLLHYLKLRNDEHAQAEIRLMAHIIEEMVKVCFPITYEAWKEFDKDAVTVSRSEYDYLKSFCNIMAMDDYLKIVHAADVDDGLNCFGSDRRKKEFVQKFMPYLLENETCNEILFGDDNE